MNDFFSAAGADKVCFFCWQIKKKRKLLMDELSLVLFFIFVHSEVIEQILKGVINHLLVETVPWFSFFYHHWCQYTWNHWKYHRIMGSFMEKEMFLSNQKQNENWICYNFLNALNSQCKSSGWRICMYFQDLS